MNIYVYIINIYRILNGKCARTVFTHELWRIRNRTSERSERVRFLIKNECVNPYKALSMLYFVYYIHTEIVG